MLFIVVVRSTSILVVLLQYRRTRRIGEKAYLRAAEQTDNIRHFGKRGRERPKKMIIKRINKYKFMNYTMFKINFVIRHFRPSGSFVLGGWSGRGWINVGNAALTNSE